MGCSSKTCSVISLMVMRVVKRESRERLEKSSFTFQNGLYPWENVFFYQLRSGIGPFGGGGVARWVFVQNRKGHGI